MSTEIGILIKAGSRSKDIKITRYWGGKEKGPCVQLTQEMEEGSWGYVQLSKEESVLLIAVLKEYVFKNVYVRGSAEDMVSLTNSKFEFSDEYIEEE